MNKIEQLKELKALLDGGAINQQEFELMKAEILGTIAAVPDKEVITTKFKSTNKIGFQIWMAENLNVSVFRNGDPIPEAKTDSDWKNAGAKGKPAWCYHEDNSNNKHGFGKLYNWFAVNDSRGLAPEGWHIPSDQEWDGMIEKHGGEEEAGKHMKSKTGWNNDEEGNSGNGTNKLGFNALPGGYRKYAPKEFKAIGEYTGFWIATEFDADVIPNSGNMCELIDATDDTCLGPWPKISGFYVRCIKDDN
jgi:uncharacterized protein (TIGR02145 family)